MRLAVTAIKETDNNLPWLILGKGKSLDKIQSMKTFDYNIMSINESYQAVKYDCRVKLKAVIFNNAETLEKLHKDPPPVGTSLLTPRSFTNHNMKKLQDVNFWVKNAHFLRAFRDNFYYYSPCFNWLERRDEFPVIAYNSTFESALWVLGYAGVKNIFTCGVDHDCGYHHSFGDSQVSYAAVKYYAQVPIDHFGLNVRAL